ncbi:HesB/IscA family protein [Methylacidimicrobium tartarophylax]|uniref:Iron-sulfur cluster insertion protein ErpA n=1 Tax=Methylacidimicrobium tartarophylax TaxID=1041768 RepID=A0A5E6MAC5_9BACT|nr:iron-sulfur cluster assembly accessory protein [Methylacidimicrobium tartarophylax]VVM06355.1 Iron-sulfur cluster insertion protein ErpA [Methylacidimicrobium tartarophylax]
MEGASLVSYTVGNEKLCQITSEAARELSRLLQDSDKAGGALRIAVVGGGCSGLQYQMDLVDRLREKDILVEAAGVRLVVDPKSALFLAGSILDYSDDLQNRGFVVKNPNASSHCSCGKSFSV